MSQFARIDNNKLLTSSFHEEVPTSYEMYSNQYSIVSPGEELIDSAIEPVEETGQDVINDYEETLGGFKRDFISRIWMTYRRDFAAMAAEVRNVLYAPNNGYYTSDCGWGCMIRSGQMMLAQALVVHFLGRSWRYDHNTQLINTTEDQIHRKIIRFFGDQASRASPFSIHKLVDLGKKNGKKVGEWYGELK
jgi:cysteine protease ATG4